MQARTQCLRSLRSFTWVSWGYLPSADISCRPQFRRFLPSFLCCYLFSKWNIYFSILVFSDPILFSLFSCVLFSLSFNFYIFPLSYFAYSLLSLSPSALFVFCFFHAAFHLSPLTILVYHLGFSFCFYLFLCLLLSFLDFFYFHSLPVFYYIPLTIFFIFLRICVFFIIIIFILLFFFSVSSTFQFFVCLFCLFFYIMGIWCHYYSFFSKSILSCLSRFLRDLVIRSFTGFLTMGKI